MIGEALTKRRSMGMTQQQVADRLSKPQSYIAKVERGERRLDIVEFVALSRALGLDPSEFFDEVLIRGVSKPIRLEFEFFDEVPMG